MTKKQISGLGWFLSLGFALVIACILAKDAPEGSVFNTARFVYTFLFYAMFRPVYWFLVEHGE